MCRLTAYVGAEAPMAPLMFGGDHSLYRQSWAPRELLHGSVNADGYGVVWYPAAVGGTPVRLARAEPVWFDPDLEGLLAASLAPVGLAALRNATPGLPVERTATLPLIHGPWSFVLNGFVPAFRERHMRALRSGLSDDLYGTLQGASDSETLFLLLVQALGGGASPLEALRHVQDVVRRRLADDPPAPLTMVLGHASGVWALNGGTAGGPRNSLYVARAAAVAPQGAVLASERLDGDAAWQAVPPDGAVTLTAQGVEFSGPGGP